MAETYPITVEEGADWPFNLRLVEDGVPVDLSGWRAEIQIREVPSSPEAMVAIRSVDGDIALGADGTISALLPAARTREIQVSARSRLVRVLGRPMREVGFWDLKLTSPDDAVLRLLEGPVLFSPEVTR